MSESPEHRITLTSFAPRDGTRLYATRCSCGWTSRRQHHSADAEYEATSHLDSVRTLRFPGPRAVG